MQTTTKNPQANWYVQLTQRLEDVATRNGITGDAASELKVFFLEIAKEQYMAGNRSGIRWARQNP